MNPQPTTPPPQPGPSSQFPTPGNVPPVRQRRNFFYKDKLRGVITTVALFAAAFLVALFLTAFVFQQYEVDGPSMQPTLHNDDRLIVIKIQRSWARLTGHPYVPARGNVIIFSEPNLYSSNGTQEKQLVKRVIGLPGDRVVVNGGVITIFDKQYPNGFHPDTSLPYGKNVVEPTTGNINIVVPANQVFVCGDNRPDSLDSRYFGTVPLNNIIGKLDFRIYPFDKIKFF